MKTFLIVAAIWSLTLFAQADREPLSIEEALQIAADSSRNVGALRAAVQEWDYLLWERAEGVVPLPFPETVAKGPMVQVIRGDIRVSVPGGDPSMARGLAIKAYVAQGPMGGFLDRTFPYSTPSQLSIELARPDAFLQAIYPSTFIDTAMEAGRIVPISREKVDREPSLVGLIPIQTVAVGEEARGYASGWDPLERTNITGFTAGFGYCLKRQAPEDGWTRSLDLWREGDIAGVMLTFTDATGQIARREQIRLHVPSGLATYFDLDDRSAPFRAERWRTELIEQETLSGARVFLPRVCTHRQGVTAFGEREFGTQIRPVGTPERVFRLEYAYRRVGAGFLGDIDLDVEAVQSAIGSAVHELPQAQGQPNGGAPAGAMVTLNAEQAASGLPIAPLDAYLQGAVDEFISHPWALDIPRDLQDWTSQ